MVPSNCLSPIDFILPPLTRRSPLSTLTFLRPVWEDCKIELGLVTLFHLSFRLALQLNDHSLVPKNNPAKESLFRTPAQILSPYFFSPPSF